MLSKTISHYKILEKLGNGGMGVVYKAVDTKLNRFVALKFLLPNVSANQNRKKRFINEAKVTAALEHNNICNIHEIGEMENGQLYIAMAYYDGETLNKKIACRSLSLVFAIKIGIQVSQGLSSVHEVGIIHRDIKPANLMITNRGEVKILDFGLAKVVGWAESSKEDSTFGTISYMSPEQTLGLEVDNRTDIWSLGVVLYEMVTGQVPFKWDYEQAVFYSILNEDAVPITDLQANAPLELEQIVNKAMAKNPEERYQKIGEMLFDLNRLLNQMELSGKIQLSHVV